MVGCMAGTSLAMAPGMVVAQLASIIGLDGPLLHARDRTPGIEYRNGLMQIPPRGAVGLRVAGDAPRGRGLHE